MNEIFPRSGISSNLANVLRPPQPARKGIVCDFPKDIGQYAPSSGIQEIGVHFKAYKRDEGMLLGPISVRSDELVSEHVPAVSEIWLRSDLQKLDIKYLFTHYGVVCGPSALWMCTIGTYSTPQRPTIDALLARTTV